ncbi:DUF5684 domain-containing protein [Halorussus litoreus]|uniref:DUF5684 domain-containing protein n=1 Tax=Halorussus litoreus TaxID=1710536 RepID=UPI000E2319DF|nr:DUF5684 domain-containing protein [Halorussus litoreus]
MAQNAAGTMLLVVYLAIIVTVIAGTWKVFTKADRAGWASLIPIYNLYVMLKIGGNPWWYLLLMMVPLVNLYALGKMYIDLARAFGKGIGYGLGLWILPFVFFPLLGFSDAQYRGAGGGGGRGGGGGVGSHSSL